MTCSPARLAANRANALRSTGPKTAEGKAATRLNAFKHGMAGQGDVAGPADDQALVAERAGAFARELGATDPIGAILAHRAALLSVRMEGLAERDLAGVAADVAAAHAAFDAERAAAIDGWIAALDGPDPRAAVEALAGSPDGLARMTIAWEELAAAVRADDRPEAADRAARRLGLIPAAGPWSAAALGPRIEAEVDRLRRLAGSMGAVADAIDRERADAGHRARFDPSPAAALARRYEAAAERGMYRALRAIADRHRQADRAAAAAAAAAAAIPQFAAPTGDRAIPVPPPGGPRPGRAPAFAPDRAGPLGSFRAEAPAGLDPRGLAVGRDPAAGAGPRRRPDLRKLGGKKR